jgi:O-antigen ligase
LAWALWAAASALPWLLPDHNEPWSTFHSEALLAALLLPIAVWALWVAKGRWKVDGLCAGVAIASLVPLAQAGAGLITLPAEAPLASQYLSAFALTLLVARHAEEVAPARLADALFAGLLIAGILSTGLALYQWLGLDGLGIWASPLSWQGARPTANVGQPNNLSTLLVWGLVATWWALVRRQISGTVATFAGAFLIMGVVLTQSRTGGLSIVALGVVALIGRRALGTRTQAPVFIALAIWFLVWTVGLPTFSEWLQQEAPRALGDQAAPKERLMIWQFALQAIAERPWFGHGWNQTTTAHVGLAAQFPTHVTAQYAHNFVLDLVLWNGLPLAALMLAGLLLWARQVLRSGLNDEKTLLWAALGVFLIHASLELPHVLANFLLPAAIFMGTLSAKAPGPVVVRVPRALLAMLLALHAVVLALAFADYSRIEANSMSWRLRAARIGLLEPPEEPPIYWLQSLQQALATLRTQPKRGMSADALDRMRRVVTRYPVHVGLLRYAQAAALNGQPEQASWALTVLCDVNPVAYCLSAANDWKLIAADGNPEMESVQVPAPSPQGVRLH